MLGKLLKYDLKWIYKLIGVFYIFAIVFSIIGRGLSSIENSTIFNILGQVCIGIAISMIINSLVNNLIRAWVRFIRNIYKDESYLTHTLPVNKGTIYLSKFLAGIITMFTTTLVILVCIAICYYTKENIQMLKSMLEIAASTYNSTVVKFLLVIFGVFFVEMVFILLVGYTGIILGHKSNNNRMFKTALYSLSLYLIPQGLTLGGIFFAGLFNEGIMQLFTTSNAVSIDVIKTIMYIGIGIYASYILGYYLIDKKQFEKGVNVE